VPTLSDLVSRHATRLDAADLEWIHLLVGDWQAVSDLAFADLVLWLPTDEGDFVAIAQARPSTGATVHYDDIVGSRAPEGQRPQLQRALEEQVAQRSREPRWFGAYAVREEAIPVVRDGRPMAVIARQTNLGGARTPSRLELNYVEAADDIFGMIARGEFPAPDAPTGPRRGAPRVGDGLVRLNSEGEVLYASPNALSCFHRLGAIGDLVGRSLVEVTADLVEQQGGVDESMPLVLMGRAPWRTDVEARGVALSLRAVPLTEHGQRMGAVLLCRDVSELRRRERELITKDATIREIHHRVKNNLQTVAALLRLQARRMTVPAARAALEESVRRVTSIAVVHETLAGSREDVVAVDEVLDRVLPMLGDLTSVGPAARTRRVGQFGELPAVAATPLVLVVTELLHNAAEHAFPDGSPGSIELVAERDGDDLVVRVVDDGRGLPEGFDPSASEGLGLQIVRTLVASELGGSLAMTSPPSGPADGRSGTEVVLTLPGAGRLRR
jgi:two-component system, sensor histidine kinase PdtaS